LVLMLIGFFTLLGLKIIPVYMNNYKINSVLDGLSTDREIVGIGPGRLRQTILKRLDINMVSGLEAEDILIEKIGNALLVTIDFETRKSLTSNISIVINYNNSVEVPIR